MATPAIYTCCLTDYLYCGRRVAPVRQHGLGAQGIGRHSHRSLGQREHGGRALRGVRRALALALTQPLLLNPALALALALT